jgi:murein L,D-transpeptidase YcbB/YkuD
MKQILHLCVAALLLSLSVHSTANAADELASALQQRLKSASGSQTANEFYSNRQYQAAWLKNRSPNASAFRLIAMLQSSSDDGLKPANYQIEKLQLKAQQKLDLQSAVEFDFEMTSAFFGYSRDLAFGRVDTKTACTNWQASRDPIDLPSLLEASLRSDDFGSAYAQLVPKSPQYAGLKEQLQIYSALQSHSWPAIPAGRWKIGDSEEAIAPLRERLEILEHLKSDGSEREMFDARLEMAVKTFQSGHGLRVDGVVGPETSEQLNVRPEERARQIAANMERIRWLPDRLPDRVLVVNIPAFSLSLFEGGKPVLRARTIVGKVTWCSPVFLNSEITKIILNPAWDVPRAIAVREILPLVRKNLSYLAKNQIRVYGQSGRIDPSSINWGQISAGNFPYHLQQEPGPGNSLGQIKFYFYNKGDCYLHDTPAKALFEKSTRALSHGCIRVEKAFDLAVEILRGSEWSAENLRQEIDSGSRQTITLDSPVPIYLVYITCWVDDQGEIQFRRDIYGQDLALLRLLDAPKN